MKELTASVARRLLDYDPETGALLWKERQAEDIPDEAVRARTNTRYAGRPAGTVWVGKDGYRRHAVYLLGRRYMAGRVAWLIMTGSWPEGDIDHINRDSTDHRWSNLRDVPSEVNQKNKSRFRNNSGLPTGVYFSAERCKWRARIGGVHNRKHLGWHCTLIDAVAARKRAERELGYSPGHGSPRNQTQEELNQ